MANELKPCLAAFIKWTKQHHADWNLSPVHINGQFSKFMDPDTDTAWLGFEAAWNTRPAAPDVWLETVSYEVFYAPTREWTKTTIPNYYRDNDNLVRELVTRSQAEAIIAAERAKVQHWQEQYTEMHSQFIDLAKSAEADNAALTARVKELDRCHEGTVDLCNQKSVQIEALEAQLAAAHKIIGDCLKELDRSQRPSFKWQLRARAIFDSNVEASHGE